MDPNACVKRIMSLYNAKAYRLAQEAAADLDEWIARGGFKPRLTKDETRVYRELREMTLLGGAYIGY